MTQALMSTDVGGPAIVANQTFILATRDTGYRSVAAAIAELVDNSLQARATHIRVFVRDENSDRDRSVTVGVLDDGHGMDAHTLQAALQFGGSDRFGERTGLGRFGMGLPNSSVSQTRRFDVFSWQNRGPIRSCYLDVDEVAAGHLKGIPAPTEQPLPAWAVTHALSSGTLVVWTRCDRLSRLKASTIANRLRQALGKLYRFSLWQGVRISVNEIPVTPNDPLFVHRRSPLSGATLFGSPLKYEFAAAVGGSGTIEVRFSELPVSEWRGWSTEDKRRFGIVGRAGVSIVRAGREIDYGWFLMGSKRRENYDDWWRCEVRFPPALDELFGVTHSKQGVTPSQELRDALEPDLESIARILNSRVREAFEQAKLGDQGRSERLATERDQFLPAPTTRRKIAATGLRYRIEIGVIPGPDFYRADVVQNTVLVTLNREHPFFHKVYLPISEGESRERDHIECLLLAAARADLEAGGTEQREFLARVRRSWADAIATFLDS